MLDLMVPNTVSHKGKLDTKTLAALCTASRENGAAALGSHTCTETVGLCALAGIRLVGALHHFSFQIYSNFEIIRCADGTSRIKKVRAGAIHLCTHNAHAKERLSAAQDIDMAGFDDMPLHSPVKIVEKEAGLQAKFRIECIDRKRIAMVLVGRTRADISVYNFPACFLGSADATVRPLDEGKIPAMAGIFGNLGGARVDAACRPMDPSEPAHRNGVVVHQR